MKLQLEERENAETGTDFIFFDSKITLVKDYIIHNIPIKTKHDVEKKKSSKHLYMKLVKG